MRETVQTFLSTVHERGHVLKLIEKLDRWTLRLVIDQKYLILSFHNGSVSLLEDSSEREVTCEIYGHVDFIDQLVEGKEKLTTLIRNGQLQVAASFRSVLLLESIFYLTKAQVKY